MSYSSAAVRRRSALSALLLALALLFAQWLGLAHRIEHAGVAQAAQQAQVDESSRQADASYDKSLNHSCSLLDAAALASVLHSPAVSLAVLPGAQVLALWVAFASWDAPFLRFFCSRAPPLV